DSTSSRWRALDRFSHAAITVASATTCDIGNIASDVAAISGTTTITGFGAAANKIRFVNITGSPLLTHNATSLILPSGANIQSAAGDCFIARSDASGNWRVLAYQKASGKAVVANTLDELQASGALVLAAESTVASNTTTNIGAATANRISITGTT